MQVTCGRYWTLIGAVAIVLVASCAAEQPPAGSGAGADAGDSTAPAQGPGGTPNAVVLGATPQDLPDAPTAVSLPDFEPVTGPGPMYDSSPAQWPGRDMAHYGYEAQEYFVSGTANGAPYTTRLVIRQPTDASQLSGLAVAEAMHPIGGAHAFEYNSVYLMDAGHVAVEIGTAADVFGEVVGVALYGRFNPERYAPIHATPDQTVEILAQVGALVRDPRGPLGEAAPRKMVLWGTSATSFILTTYLPAHGVYRTPDMGPIYDGFMPTSTGQTIETVDVPMIQMPTQHEYQEVATAQQDSDEPGSQFRLYEVAGQGHLDSRNNGARVTQEHCVEPLSQFPLEAYMAVGLDHLLRWVDEGVAPPHAPRVLIDRDVTNDGSLMALDEHGNAVGGVRNPYVDVPVARYTAVNTATPTAGPGDMLGPALLCRLSVYETPFPAETLRDLYGSPEEYVRQFEARLTELEDAGWSLPVYHDLLVADARAVEF